MSRDPKYLKKTAKYEAQEDIYCLNCKEINCSKWDLKNASIKNSSKWIFLKIIWFGHDPIQIFGRWSGSMASNTKNWFNTMIYRDKSLNCMISHKKLMIHLGIITLGNGIFRIVTYLHKSCLATNSNTTRDFFFGVCYALGTRLKTLSRLKQSILNGVLNIRLKRFKYFKQKNKWGLWK